MLKYIYSDLSRAVRYLPYGLALGVPVAVFIVWLINRQRRKKQKEPLSWVPVVIFGIYLAVLLMITFLSRESGSSKGVIDMDLFSTWGINDRNNAFVVENVLLFIPYGFLCSWNFKWAKKAGRGLRPNPATKGRNRPLRRHGADSAGFASLCVQTVRVLCGITP